MNVFTCVGHIGKDAMLQTVGQNNTPVCKFSVAVNSGYGDNQKTSWVGCSLWGKRAQPLQPHLLKGTKVCVSGEISLETWQGQQGQQSMIAMNVREVTLCGQPNQPQGQQNAYPPQQGYQQPGQQQQGQQPQPNGGNYAPDVPF